MLVSTTVKSHAIASFRQSAVGTAAKINPMIACRTGLMNASDRNPNPNQDPKRLSSSVRTRLACDMLDRMTELGRPKSHAIEL